MAKVEIEIKFYDFNNNVILILKTNEEIYNEFKDQNINNLKFSNYINYFKEKHNEHIYDKNTYKLDTDTSEETYVEKKVSLNANNLDKPEISIFINYKQIIKLEKMGNVDEYKLNLCISDKDAEKIIEKISKEDIINENLIKRNVSERFIRLLIIDLIKKICNEFGSNNYSDKDFIDKILKLLNSYSNADWANHLNKLGNLY